MLARSNDGANALEGGFADPVADSQAVFRTVMDAMARPAVAVSIRPRTTPPAPLPHLLGDLACALADADTPIWLDDRLAGSDAVKAWLAFHTGARLVSSPAEAAFALVAEPSGMPSLDTFAAGSQDYPDRSATLLINVASLEGGKPLIFRGPGIEGRAAIAPVGLPADFANLWRENARLFPRGVDIVLVTDTDLACLPRSSRLIEGEG